MCSYKNVLRACLVSLLLLTVSCATVNKRPKVTRKPSSVHHHPDSEECLCDEIETISAEELRRYQNPHYDVNPGRKSKDIIVGTYYGSNGSKTSEY